MSNENATFKVTLTVPGLTPELATVAAPYQARLSGLIDVPDGTAAETEIDIPFGSVDDEATGLLIRNTLAQPVDLKINGNATYSIPPGGMAAFAGPVANAGTKLTSAAVVTTAEQDGAGKIAFSVFGDPTA